MPKTYPDFETALDAALATGREDAIAKYTKDLDADIGALRKKTLAQREEFLASARADFAAKYDAENVRQYLSCRRPKPATLLKWLGERLPAWTFPFIGEIAAEKWPDAYPTAYTGEEVLMRAWKKKNQPTPVTL